MFVRKYKIKKTLVANRVNKLMQTLPQSFAKTFPMPITGFQNQNLPGFAQFVAQVANVYGNPVEVCVHGTGRLPT